VAKSQDPIKSFIKKVNKNSNEKITYEAVISIIEAIAKTHRSKKFGFMTEEDIESQVRLICIQQIKFFEPSKMADITHAKSLERWLNKIVKNRLKNFYRDHCLSVNERHSNSRQALSRSASSLEERNDTITDNAVKKSTVHGDIEFLELLDTVVSKLEPHYLEIYHACINDEAVTPYYKNKLLVRIREIISEWSGNE
jgi:hypothetical protein